jgi:oxidase EvaA
VGASKSEADSQDLERIRRLIDDERRSVLVESVDDGAPDWQVSKGRLVNRQSDYFSIGAVIDGTGTPKFVLRQKEPVLVMLLVKRTDAGVFVLLSIRSEPGLIGLTCLTTTIQSTRSNYMRKHGGKATPYLEYARNQTLGNVIHDSMQYDWGDFYEGKIKRFLILEVDSDFCRAGQGFAWVSLHTARHFLIDDDIVTNDLRACLALVVDDLEEQHSVAATLIPMGLAPNASKPHEEDPSLEYRNLQHLRVQNRDQVTYRDGLGNVVAFFRTITKSREVDKWIQPLLHVRDSRRVVLYASMGETTLYALRLSPQFASPGTMLWMPSEPITRVSGTRLVSSTSGEGGRFYKYRIHLELRSVDKVALRESEWPEDTVWLSRHEVQRLIVSSLLTSLELRLVWSLVLASQD